MARVKQRTLTGLVRKGTLQKWRSEQGHRQVHIWSDQWGSYWRPDGCGYTRDIRDAGVYTLDDAIRRSGHCGPEKQIVYRFID